MVKVVSNNSKILKRKQITTSDKVPIFIGRYGSRFFKGYEILLFYPQRLRC